MRPLFGRGDVRFFDRVARLYDLLMPRASADDFRDAVAFAERPVERVLDLAGGSGRVAEALGSVGYDPVVADLSRPMLRRARERGLEAVESDAGRLPFPDSAFDAIVLVDAYHHLPEQQAALDEAARVVAPGGVVVVRDFDSATLLGQGISAGEAVFRMGSRFADPDSVAASLTRAGLHSRVLERGVVYTVVGRKPQGD